jgi:RNA polymerase sigma factor (sigma-70 family)
MNRGELYEELTRYVRRKFSTRPGIAKASEDIVGDVLLEFYAKHGTDSDKENFGYLSVSCIHQAYKRFKATNKNVALDDCLNFLSDDDVVDEIIQNDETETIFKSLEVLKVIEKAIIIGRYYGDLKFAEIAENLGLNISTVKSHHRRAEGGRGLLVAHKKGNRWSYSCAANQDE